MYIILNCNNDHFTCLPLKVTQLKCVNYKNSSTSIMFNNIVRYLQNRCYFKIRRLPKVGEIYQKQQKIKTPIQNRILSLYFVV